MNDLNQPIDTLVHIADLHFWRVTWNPLRLMNKRFLGNLNVALRRRHEFALEQAGRCADAIAATKVPFVVLTGDFTSTALEAEFEQARAFVQNLRDRGLALALVPGNHDLYTFEAQRKRRFERYLGEFLPKEGYPCRVQLPGGVSLLLVSMVRPNLLTSRGCVTPATIKAVAQLLEGCGETALVAGHYPILTDPSGRRVAWDRRLGNAESLRELLRRSGRRILYLCGHEHRFSYLRDSDYPALEQVSTAPLLAANRQRGFHGEFTEVHVLPEGFRILRHYHDGTWKETHPLLPPSHS